MEQNIQNTNTTTNTQRDYDKNPIVIIDRMPEISFWFFMSLTLIPLCAITFWLYISNKEIDWTHLSISLLILYIPTYIFLKSRIAKIRTISFYNGKVSRNWDGELLELDWKDIVSVRKSFIDFYDKSQKLDDFRKRVFSFLLIPYFILIGHPYLIVVKFIYKLIKGYSNQEIYDTIVFFDKDNLMIAVFLSSKDEFIELQDYLREKKYDMKNLQNFYSTSYAIDELTYYINKKDN